MKKICLLFVLLFGLSAKAQPFSIDTLFVSEMKYDFICISVLDSIYVLQKYNLNRQGRDNTYIVMPSSVDTLNIKTSKVPIHFGEYIFFDYNFNDKSLPVWSYSSGLQYQHFDSPFFSDFGGEYLVMLSGTSEDDYQINYYNPLTKEKTPFIKFKDLPIPTISKYAPKGDWGFPRPFIIDDKRALINLCYTFDESGYDYTYFKEENKFFLLENELKDLSPVYDYTIITNDRKAVAFRISYMEEGDYRTKYVLYTNELEPIGEILLRNTPTGLNMQKGKFSGYFLTAHLDNLYSAVFYYELNPTLELAMYKAFHDGILTQEDISGLTKKELGILRNLLFAKHNYQFDSMYYQAYYKTMEFYQVLDKKSRTKNINHLLTEADKANIALIRAAEEKAQQ